MRPNRLLFALSVVLCMAALASARDVRKPRPDRVAGMITAVAASSLNLADGKGNAVTVTADGSTKIERNGVEVKLSALQVGDRAQARFDPTTKLASKIESRGP